MRYLRREVFILKSFFSLLRRDFRKYFTVAGTTYFLGASGMYRSAKPAYFFCRYLDDLADGDRPLPAGHSFDSLIARLIYLVEFPETKEVDNLGLVLVDAIRKLKKRANDPNVVDLEFKDFLKSMLQDYERRVGFETLEQNEIDQLYDQSFASVLHLALIGLSTKLKRVNVGKLGLIQGKVYALQDMEEELRKGIINVPASVLKEAKVSLEQVMNAPGSLTDTQPYQTWRTEELNKCQTMVDELLNLDAEKKAMKMIRLLVLPLEKWVASQTTKMTGVTALAT